MRKSGIVITKEDLATLLKATRLGAIQEIIHTLHKLPQRNRINLVADGKPQTGVILAEIIEIIEKELKK